MSISAIRNPSPLFDNESFTQILPFSKDNPLEPEVQSDHAEIALKISNTFFMNTWNISNPTYHKLFKKGDNPPFHNSHLFVDKPFIEETMDKGLAEKSNNQIVTIAERFVKGEVNIQVIVEGYESFYKNLTEKITELGHEKFQIISILEQKPEKWDAKRNATGILIDTSRFSVLKSGVIHKKYVEEQDSREKDFYLPFAHIRDKTKPQSMIVAGVHINGCESQYPKTGLEILAKTIKELHAESLGEPDIIAAGDYNTLPPHVRKSVLTLLEPEGFLLKAAYPTHVNPKSQAGNYDQVVILRGKAKVIEYEMLPASDLSLASQKLIDSIEKSRQRLLTDGN